jgi:peptidoglycan/LPS O-acetylase OafA/YrhL
VRIAGLNGLRAIAVIGVLLYHGGLHATPAGFLGVDLFFVISGFLITTLLLREASACGGRIDVVAFWGRRLRRLLPGLALVVAATVVFSTVLAIADPEALRLDALAALLYVANWHFLNTGSGYFDQFALPSPLQHTWSLSIEEQFYGLWPLLLLVALRLRVPRWIQALVVAIAALLSAAWMARLIGTGVNVDRVYYGTDTRGQAILVGVFAAFLLERVANARATSRREKPSVAIRRLTDLAGVIALGCVVTAMVLGSAEDYRLFRGGLLLFAMVSGVLLAAIVLSPRGAMTRALEARPLRDVGVLSYSLYLWHWPVFLFLTAGRTALAGPALLGLRLVVTLALATAAYHLVEAPVRRTSWRPSRLVALPIGVAGMACGLALLASSAVPAQTGPQPAPGAGDALHLDRDGARATQLPAGISADPDQRLRVTLLGDSTAVTLGQGLRDLPGRRGVDFFNAATLGCGVTTASPYRYMGEVTPYDHRHCLSWEARWRARVSSRPADVVAILVGRWEVTDQVVNGTWTHVGTPLFDSYLRGQLQKAVDAASSAGAQVAFLTAPYYNRGEQPDGNGWPEDDPARVDAFNHIIRAVADQQPDLVHVVALGRRISGGGHRYVNEVDGVVLRYDGVHFTAAAGRWIQPWLCQQLEVARENL